MKKIVIIAATQGELSTLCEELSVPAGEVVFQLGHLSIRFVTSGIGAVASAISTTRELLTYQPDILLQVGIAGTYRRDITLGSVVEVSSELEGDLGIEQSDGSILSLSESGLDTSDRVLTNPHNLHLGLPFCAGLTLQTVTGSNSRLAYLKEHFSADVESMEGAGFFRSCLQSDQPFAQIRAISNYVESRNRGNWKMELALSNLANEVSALLRKMSM